MKTSTFSFLPPTPALIITYNPSAGFEYQLAKLFAKFEKIILVDNGSLPEFQQTLKAQARQWGRRLELLINPHNFGVAKALNQGFAVAIDLGYDYIFTLDQDSVPVSDMSEEILKVYNNTASNQGKIAIIAPLIEDPEAGIIARYLRPKHHFFFERKNCTDETLDNISIVITSGSLYNLRVYKQLGPFRDDFFVDYVDTEYCLRARQHGYNIIVACNAHLLHKLGNQIKINIANVEIRPTFHSPIRWYYISRNRISMIKLYGYRFPHWLLYEIVINSYGLLRMLLFEDQKIKKLLAVLFGSIDGLLGRSGEIPSHRKASLSKTN